jgi:nucleotide-binding universal stress UspA family protein
MAQRIVVGIDGSSGSATAARWAISQARATEASVELVYTWHLPYLTEASGYGMSVHVLAGSWHDVAQEADKEAARILAQLGVPLEGIEIGARAVEGPAAFTLMQEAKGADMLVVGRRGHGGFFGLHLGSVTTQLAHHYDGVLVMVPETATF